jgi:hypothetical protein
MQVFERYENGDPWQEYESTSGGVTGLSMLRTAGVTTLGCALSSSMPSGTLYSMAASTLHRIVTAGDTLIATLFLRGPIVRHSTTICSDRATNRLQAVASPTMSPELFDHRVTEYLEALKASPAGMASGNA